MLKRIVLFMVGVVLFIGCSDSPPPPEETTPMPAGISQNKPVEDAVIVTVNGKEFKRSDVMKKFNELRMRGMSPQPQQVVEDMVAEELLYNAAVQSDVIVSASEVQGILDSIILQTRGKENLERQLQQMGYSYDEFENNIKRQTYIKDYIDTVKANKISISDASMEEYYNNNPKQYERVHASHILIKPDDPSEEKKAEAKAKIQKIADQIKAGSDFAELARTESVCPSGIRAGGDLGEFPRGKMVPSFEDAAFSTAPGEMSDIIETQHGYHIIKVHEHNNMTLDEAKEEIKTELENRELGKILRELIQELTQKATIEYAQQNPAPPVK